MSFFHNIGRSLGHIGHSIGQSYHHFANSNIGKGLGHVAQKIYDNSGTLGAISAGLGATMIAAGSGGAVPLAVLGVGAALQTLHAIKSGDAPESGIEKTANTAKKVQELGGQVSTVYNKNKKKDTIK